MRLTEDTRLISAIISPTEDEVSGASTFGSLSSAPDNVITPPLVRTEILPRSIQCRTNTLRTAQLISRSESFFILNQPAVADEGFHFFVEDGDGVRRV